jgi:hypothetical protein
MAHREDKLAEFGAEVREALASESSASEEIRLARAGFLQQIATRNAGATRPTVGFLARRWRALLMVGATATAVVAVWAYARLPVSFKVGPTATRGQAGDLVRADAGTPMQLRFSEGSSLVLGAGGRLRVLATHAAGARILVEDGTVDAHIVPARLGKKQWSFEAGPFHVQVVGTRFRLSYRAQEQSLALSTHEGRVVVTGPCVQGPTAVSAGSRLDLTCLAPQLPPPRTASIAAEPAVPPAAKVEVDPPSVKPVRRTSAWRELLLAGRLREGLRAAERADFARVCQVATAKELLALADAARLFGRSNRAETALRTLRQRFPKSAEASTAAFTLGRVAFERKRAYGEAVKWFGTYLREQPNGPLMGDSMGRLMEAKLLAGDGNGARTDAEGYLRRFPEGPYASEARGILSK